ncbi:hypothetical protein ACN20G_29905 (plasmid) [Streptomyces sp. BI20]|uniref:hypothetical protein n=1 Tax=Streptomyces sp. BI20 TaxID=3403460 RepID=UPI003C75ABE6
MKVYRGGKPLDVKTLMVRRGGKWVKPSEVKVREAGAWRKVWPMRSLGIAQPKAGSLAPHDKDKASLISWRFSTLDGLEAVDKVESHSGRTVPSSAVIIPKTGDYRVTYQAEVRRPNINQLVYVRSRLSTKAGGKETTVWPSTGSWSETSTRNEYQMSNPCVLEKVRLTEGSELYPLIQGYWASGGSQALTGGGHFTIELIEK